MLKLFRGQRFTLIARLVLSTGLTLFLGFSIWAFYNISLQKQKITKAIVIESDRLSNTIMLGAHYAMMLNSRDDIDQIIQNISRQENIAHIRIYNKSGTIKFSNRAEEVEQSSPPRGEACVICHLSEPPRLKASLEDRTRIFQSTQGHRQLGIITPIYNEAGCSTDPCHAHPTDRNILGLLDVVYSMEKADRELRMFEHGILVMAAVMFLLLSGILSALVFKMVRRPIQGLITGTRMISDEEYECAGQVLHKLEKHDEIGQLATAIKHMSLQIKENQTELNRQKEEYQKFFEEVPCIISIQDRSFRMLRYNRRFAEMFQPRPGDYCYFAYKGRSEKCPSCPVEQTFADGQPHFSEESGFSRDGTRHHWIVRTSPILDERGEVIAAMEMCLDITPLKELQDRLEISEKKYFGIFENIPNPIFVLNIETLQVLDCNRSVESVYGYEKEKIIGRRFMEFFLEDERDDYEIKLRNASIMDRVKHLGRDRRIIFVNIRISPAEYPGQKVFLVTTSDITKRLEAEQQLAHAGKMATLGEMATGIAHELNQPLTVMKTASAFLSRKVEKGEPIPPETLQTMARKINGNVDRASKIINHMRQFARKPDIKLEKVQVNEIFEKALEMFSQQLKLKGIEVIWDLDLTIPVILAEPGRLEQVFVNLLINARDAIEEKCLDNPASECEKKIILMSRRDQDQVVVKVMDTGKGIPESIAARIFEPFFTTKEVGKGTGIGLSISYGIIKEFGAAIRLDRDYTQGAAFVITFPPFEAAPAPESVSTHINGLLDE